MKKTKKIFGLLLLLMFSYSCNHHKEKTPEYEAKFTNYNVSPSSVAYANGGEKKNVARRTGNSSDSEGSTVSTTNGRLTKYQLYSKHGQFVASQNDKEIFAKHYSSVAQEEYRLFGIPASVTLSQAILESGADSELAKKYNGFFGIKCKGDMTYGEIDCVVHPTDPSRGVYAVYESPWFSFRAHSKFLKNRAYYKSCFECGDDTDCWFRELQKFYCPEPDYALGLTNTRDRYNLTQYDIKPQPIASKTPSRTNISPSGGSGLNVGKNFWILNNSHGDDTPGKRYTFKKKLNDGSYTIFEYKLNRAVVKKVAARCKELGLLYKVLVPELHDVSLNERVKRANDLEKKHGNTFLVTFDHNATSSKYENDNKPSISEDYAWYDANPKEAKKKPYAASVATGMEGFYNKGNEKSKDFLETLMKNINKRMTGWYSRGNKTARFYTIRKTSMPSVTLEMAFFDNYGDANFANSDEAQDRICEGIIETFCAYDEDIEYQPAGVVVKNKLKKRKKRKKNVRLIRK